MLDIHACCPVITDLLSTSEATSCYGSQQEKSLVDWDCKHFMPCWCQGLSSIWGFPWPWGYPNSWLVYFQGKNPHLKWMTGGTPISGKPPYTHFTAYFHRSWGEFQAVRRFWSRWNCGWDPWDPWDPRTTSPAVVPVPKDDLGAQWNGATPIAGWSMSGTVPINGWWLRLPRFSEMSTLAVVGYNWRSVNDSMTLSIFFGGTILQIHSGWFQASLSAAANLWGRTPKDTPTRPQSLGLGELT